MCERSKRRSAFGRSAFESAAFVLLSNAFKRHTEHTPVRQVVSQQQQAAAASSRSKQHQAVRRGVYSLISARLSTFASSLTHRLRWSARRMSAPSCKARSSRACPPPRRERGGSRGPCTRRCTAFQPRAGSPHAPFSWGATPRGRWPRSSGST